MSAAEQIGNVSVQLKANIYFDGKVVSHSIFFPDGKKKTVGLIYPGSYHFNTDLPERMDLISGICRVKISGDPSWKDFPAGTYFNVPAKSGFDIAVESGIAEYLCSFE